MEFSIYPFDRYNKIRLYVRFVDQFDNEIKRSTGISYTYKASNDERAKAKNQAEEEAKIIIQDYFSGNDQAYEFVDKNPRLSTFLKNEYWPHVEANCSSGTLTRYQNDLRHFIRICKDRPMHAFKRIDMERFKQARLKKAKKTTINIEIRSIKAAFNWAYKYDLIDRTPFKGQDFMFDVKSSKRAFTKKK